MLQRAHAEYGVRLAREVWYTTESPARTLTFKLGRWTGYVIGGFMLLAVVCSVPPVSIVLEAIAEARA